MKVSGKVRWDSALDAAANAKVVLPAMAADLFAAGREAAEPSSKVRRLHDFRLLTKRFRYTLEIFCPLYGPAMDDRLDRLRKLQQYLGKVSDCDATAKLLKAMAGKGKKKGQLKMVLAYIRGEERIRAANFQRYWVEVFDAPGQEERWVRYLRDYAGRASRTRVA
jgi:CHAD domain-containing protein